MKKLIMFITLLVLFIPSVVLADGYNKIKIRSIFTTSADVSGIDKIYVQYQTRAGSIIERKNVYLLKNDSFQFAVDLANPVEDISFIYGYCITYDGIADKYGFLPITSTTNYNGEDSVIELVLSVDYNNMAFDGKKYRANSDVTEDEYKERKSGKQVDTSTGSSGVVSTDTGYESDLYGQQASAPDLDSDGNVIPTTTKIINDNDKDNKKNDERVEDTKTYKILVIIAAVIGIAVAIVAVVLIVKMNQANKRV